MEPGARAEGAERSRLPRTQAKLTGTGEDPGPGRVATAAAGAFLRSGSAPAGAAASDGPDREVVELQLEGDTATLLHEEAEALFPGFAAALPSVTRTSAPLRLSGAAGSAGPLRGTAKLSARKGELRLRLKPAHLLGGAVAIQMWREGGALVAELVGASDAVPAAVGGAAGRGKASQPRLEGLRSDGGGDGDRPGDSEGPTPDPAFRFRTARGSVGLVTHTVRTLFPEHFAALTAAPAGPGPSRPAPAEASVTLHVRLPGRSVGPLVRQAARLEVLPHSQLHPRHPPWTLSWRREPGPLRELGPGTRAHLQLSRDAGGRVVAELLPPRGRSAGGAGGGRGMGSSAEQPKEEGSGSGSETADKEEYGEPGVGKAAPAAVLAPRCGRFVTLRPEEAQVLFPGINTSSKVRASTPFRLGGGTAGQGTGQATLTSYYSVLRLSLSPVTFLGDANRLQLWREGGTLVVEQSGQHSGAGAGGSTGDGAGAAASSWDEGDAEVASVTWPLAAGAIQRAYFHVPGAAIEGPLQSFLKSAETRVMLNVHLGETAHPRPQLRLVLSRYKNGYRASGLGPWLRERGAAAGDSLRLARLADGSLRLSLTIAERAVADGRTLTAAESGDMPPAPGGAGNKAAPKTAAEPGPGQGGVEVLLTGSGQAALQPHEAEALLTTDEGPLRPFLPGDIGEAFKVDVQAADEPGRLLRVRIRGSADASFYWASGLMPWLRERGASPGDRLRLSLLADGSLALSLLRQAAGQERTTAGGGMPPTSVEAAPGEGPSPAQLPKEVSGGKRRREGAADQDQRGSGGPGPAAAAPVGPRITFLGDANRLQLWREGGTLVVEQSGQHSGAGAGGSTGDGAGAAASSWDEGDAEVASVTWPLAAGAIQRAYFHVPGAAIEGPLQSFLKSAETRVMLNVHLGETAHPRPQLRLVLSRYKNGYRASGLGPWLRERGAAAGDSLRLARLADGSLRLSLTIAERAVADGRTLTAAESGDMPPAPGGAGNKAAPKTAAEPGPGQGGVEVLLTGSGQAALQPHEAEALLTTDEGPLRPFLPGDIGEAFKVDVQAADEPGRLLRVRIRGSADASFYWASGLMPWLRERGASPGDRLRLSLLADGSLALSLLRQAAGQERTTAGGGMPPTSVEAAPGEGPSPAQLPKEVSGGKRRREGAADQDQRGSGGPGPAAAAPVGPRITFLGDANRLQLWREGGTLVVEQSGQHSGAGAGGSTGDGAGAAASSWDEGDAEVASVTWPLAAGAIQRAYFHVPGAAIEGPLQSFLKSAETRVMLNVHLGETAHPRPQLRLVLSRYKNGYRASGLGPWLRERGAAAGDSLRLARLADGSLRLSLTIAERAVADGRTLTAAESGDMPPAPGGAGNKAAPKTAAEPGPGQGGVEVLLTGSGQAALQPHEAEALLTTDEGPLRPFLPGDIGEAFKVDVQAADEPGRLLRVRIRGSADASFYWASGLMPWLRERGASPGDRLRLSLLADGSLALSLLRQAAGQERTTAGGGMPPTSVEAAPGEGPSPAQLPKEVSGGKRRREGAADQDQRGSGGPGPAAAAPVGPRITFLGDANRLQLWREGGTLVVEQSGQHSGAGAGGSTGDGAGAAASSWDEGDAEVASVTWPLAAGAIQRAYFHVPGAAIEGPLQSFLKSAETRVMLNVHLGETAHPRPQLRLVLSRYKNGYRASGLGPWLRERGAAAGDSLRLARLADGSLRLSLTIAERAVADGRTLTAAESGDMPPAPGGAGNKAAPKTAAEPGPGQGGVEVLLTGSGQAALQPHEAEALLTTDEGPLRPFLPGDIGEAFKVDVQAADEPGRLLRVRIRGSADASFYWASGLMPWLRERGASPGDRLRLSLLADGSLALSLLRQAAGQERTTAGGGMPPTSVEAAPGEGPSPAQLPKEVSGGKRRREGAADQDQRGSGGPGPAARSTCRPQEPEEAQVLFPGINTSSKVRASTPFRLGGGTAGQGTGQATLTSYYSVLRLSLSPVTFLGDANRLQLWREGGTLVVEQSGQHSGAGAGGSTGDGAGAAASSWDEGDAEVASVTWPLAAGAIQRAYFHVPGAAIEGPLQSFLKSAETRVMLNVHLGETAHPRPQLRLVLSRYKNGYRASGLGPWLRERGAAAGDSLRLARLADGSLRLSLTIAERAVADGRTLTAAESGDMPPAPGGAGNKAAPKTAAEPGPGQGGVEVLLTGSGQAALQPHEAEALLTTDEGPLRPFLPGDIGEAFKVDVQAADEPGRLLRVRIRGSADASFYWASGLMPWLRERGASPGDRLRLSLLADGSLALSLLRQAAGQERTTAGGGMPPTSVEAAPGEGPSPAQLPKEVSGGKRRREGAADQDQRGSGGPGPAAAAPVGPRITFLGDANRLQLWREGGTLVVEQSGQHSGAGAGGSTGDGAGAAASSWDEGDAEVASVTWPLAAGAIQRAYFHVPGAAIEGPLQSFLKSAETRVMLNVHLGETAHPRPQLRLVLSRYKNGYRASGLGPWLRERGAAAGDSLRLARLADGSLRLSLTIAERAVADGRTLTAAESGDMPPAPGGAGNKAAPKTAAEPGPGQGGVEVLLTGSGQAALQPHEAEALLTTDEGPLRPFLPGDIGEAFKVDVQAADEPGRLLRVRIRGSADASFYWASGLMPWLRERGASPGDRLRLSLLADGSLALSLLRQAAGQERTTAGGGMPPTSVEAAPGEGPSPAQLPKEVSGGKRRREGAADQDQRGSGGPGPAAAAPVGPRITFLGDANRLQLWREGGTLVVEQSGQHSGAGAGGSTGDGAGAAASSWDEGDAEVASVTWPLAAGAIQRAYFHVPGAAIEGPLQSFLKSAETRVMLNVHLGETAHPRPQLRLVLSRYKNGYRASGLGPWLRERGAAAGDSLRLARLADGSLRLSLTIAERAVADGRTLTAAESGDMPPAPGGAGNKAAPKTAAEPGPGQGGVEVLLTGSGQAALQPHEAEALLTTDEGPLRPFLPGDIGEAFKVDVQAADEPGRLLRVRIRGSADASFYWASGLMPWLRERDASPGDRLRLSLLADGSLALSLLRQAAGQERTTAGGGMPPTSVEAAPGEGPSPAQLPKEVSGGKRRREGAADQDQRGSGGPGPAAAAPVGPRITFLGDANRLQLWREGGTLVVEQSGQHSGAGAGGSTGDGAGAAASSWDEGDAEVASVTWPLAAGAIQRAYFHVPGAAIEGPLQSFLKSAETRVMLNVHLGETAHPRPQLRLVLSRYKNGYRASGLGPWLRERGAAAGDSLRLARLADGSLRLSLTIAERAVADGRTLTAAESGDMPPAPGGAGNKAAPKTAAEPGPGQGGVEVLLTGSGQAALQPHEAEALLTTDEGPLRPFLPGDIGEAFKVDVQAADEPGRLLRVRIRGSADASFYWASGLMPWLRERGASPGDRLRLSLLADGSLALSLLRQAAGQERTTAGGGMPPTSVEAAPGEGPSPAQLPKEVSGGKRRREGAADQDQRGSGGPGPAAAAPVGPRITFLGDANRLQLWREGGTLVVEQSGQHSGAGAGGSTGDGAGAAASSWDEGDAEVASVTWPLAAGAIQRAYFHVPGAAIEGPLQSFLKSAETRVMLNVHLGETAHPRPQLRLVLSRYKNGYRASGLGPWLRERGAAAGDSLRLARLADGSLRLSLTIAERAVADGRTLTAAESGDMPPAPGGAGNKAAPKTAAEPGPGQGGVEVLLTGSGQAALQPHEAEALLTTDEGPLRPFLPGDIGEAFKVDVQAADEPGRLLRVRIRGSADASFYWASGLMPWLRERGASPGDRLRLSLLADGSLALSLLRQAAGQERTTAGGGMPPTSVEAAPGEGPSPAQLPKEVSGGKRRREGAADQDQRGSGGPGPAAAAPVGPRITFLGDANRLQLWREGGTLVVEQSGQHSGAGAGGSTGDGAGAAASSWDEGDAEVASVTWPLAAGAIQRAYFHVPGAAIEGPLQSFLKSAETRVMLNVHLGETAHPRPQLRLVLSRYKNGYRASGLGPWLRERGAAAGDSLRLARLADGSLRLSLTIAERAVADGRTLTAAESGDMPPAPGGAGNKAAPKTAAEPGPGQGGVEVLLTGSGQAALQPHEAEALLTTDEGPLRPFLPGDIGEAFKVDVQAADEPGRLLRVRIRGSADASFYWASGLMPWLRERGASPGDRLRLSLLADGSLALSLLRQAAGQERTTAGGGMPPTSVEAAPGEGPSPAQLPKEVSGGKRRREGAADQDQRGSGGPGPAAAAPVGPRSRCKPGEGAGVGGSAQNSGGLPRSLHSVPTGTPMHEAAAAGAAPAVAPHPPSACVAAALLHKRVALSPAQAQALGLWGPGGAYAQGPLPLRVAGGEAGPSAGGCPVAAHTVTLEEREGALVLRLERQARKALGGAEALWLWREGEGLAASPAPASAAEAALEPGAQGLAAAPMVGAGEGGSEGGGPATAQGCEPGQDQDGPAEPVQGPDPGQVSEGAAEPSQQGGGQGQGSGPCPRSVSGPLSVTWPLDQASLDHRPFLPASVTLGPLQPLLHGRPSARVHVAVADQPGRPLALKVKQEAGTGRYRARGLRGWLRERGARAGDLLTLTRLPEGGLVLRLDHQAGTAPGAAPDRSASMSPARALDGGEASPGPCAAGAPLRPRSHPARWPLEPAPAAARTRSLADLAVQLPTCGKRPPEGDTEGQAEAKRARQQEEEEHEEEEEEENENRAQKQAGASQRNPPPQPRPQAQARGQALSERGCPQEGAPPLAQQAAPRLLPAPSLAAAHLRPYTLPPSAPAAPPALQPGELRLCGLTFHPALAPAVRRSLAAWEAALCEQLRAEGLDGGLSDAAPEALQVCVLDGARLREAGIREYVVRCQLAHLLGLADAFDKDLPPHAPQMGPDRLAPGRDAGRGGAGLFAAAALRKGAVLGVMGGYVMPRTEARRFAARGWQALGAEAGAELAARADGGEAASGGGAGQHVRSAWQLLEGSMRLPMPGSPDGWQLSMLGYGSLAALINDPRRQPRGWLEGSDVGDEGGAAARAANCTVVPVCVRGLALPVVVAVRDVAPGEQLLRDYGAEWWREREEAWWCVEEMGAVRGAQVEGG
ncbi:hypothetical protein HYH03_014923 [Edaphochlamys debaryana]|uniref:Uncharacterized protein n=1 Tax=Edaphochlamys debaryana TaxID=47281 RepID=A0A836BRJ1_9CHLO|nr:hypothetical protein HYH03_014923 [Edaphochlamys debaryana]|eukprot:KAG2486476.1 hypothetical protein HYH03_014923 [Edaphochlamys debaryana]